MTGNGIMDNVEYRKCITWKPKRKRGTFSPDRQTDLQGMRITLKTDLMILFAFVFIAERRLGEGLQGLEPRHLARPE